MSTEPAATLRVTMRIPPPLDTRSDHERHERCLENVPESTARTIADDFAAYARGEASTDQRKLYRYRPVTSDSTDREVLLPLDFADIATLRVTSARRRYSVHSMDP